MMVLKLVSAIFVAVPVVLCARAGSSCITPNNEKATCVAVTQCKIIADTITTDNREAIDFAKRSQCGYESEPLVCCGKLDYRSGSTKLQGKSSLSPLLPDRSVCGKEKDENRVYGGTLTDIGEFPWMALLRYKNADGSDAGFKCGGTLINNRYVLTAAHCVVISSDVDTVRLGEWKISTDPDCESGLIAQKECADPVIEVKVEKVTPHPEYHRQSGKNDIALLRLKRNVQYTDSIRAICLPYTDDPYPTPGMLLFLAGWGATETSSTSDNKLKVKLPVMSKSDCDTKMRNRRRITDDHLCAGGISGQDACHGDSGGPLMKLTMTTDKKNQWVQEGVVSYGVGCGLVGYPGVYTRVVKYINWIIKNMSA